MSITAWSIRRSFSSTCWIFLFISSKQSAVSSVFMLTSRWRLSSSGRPMQLSVSFRWTRSKCWFMWMDRNNFLSACRQCLDVRRCFRFKYQTLTANLMIFAASHRRSLTNWIFKSKWWTYFSARVNCSFCAKTEISSAVEKTPIKPVMAATPNQTSSHPRYLSHGTHLVRNRSRAWDLHNLGGETHRCVWHRFSGLAHLRWWKWQWRATYYPTSRHVHRWPWHCRHAMTNCQWRRDRHRKWTSNEWASDQDRSSSGRRNSSTPDWDSPRIVRKYFETGVNGTSPNGKANRFEQTLRIESERESSPQRVTMPCWSLLGKPKATLSEAENRVVDTSADALSHGSVLVAEQWNRPGRIAEKDVSHKWLFPAGLKRIAFSSDRDANDSLTCRHNEESDSSDDSEERSQLE